MIKRIEKTFTIKKGQEIKIICRADNSIISIHGDIGGEKFPIIEISGELNTGRPVMGKPLFSKVDGEVEFNFTRDQDMNIHVVQEIDPGDTFKNIKVISVNGRYGKAVYEIGRAIRDAVWFIRCRHEKERIANR